jgi:hypothetical protein
MRYFMGYAYSVLTYTHDPVAAETLNCGLIFYCPEAKILKFIPSSDTKRLESAFPGFDPHHHNRVLHEIEAQINSHQAKAEWKHPKDLSPILDAILTDPGLSYNATPIRLGLTKRPQDAAFELTQRFLP